jgi:hypothetical protein
MRSPDRAAHFGGRSVLSPAASDRDARSRWESGKVHGFVQNLDEVFSIAAEAIDRWHADARLLLADVNRQQ